MSRLAGGITIIATIMFAFPIIYYSLNSHYGIKDSRIGIYAFALTRFSSRFGRKIGAIFHFTAFIVNLIIGSASVAIQMKNDTFTNMLISLTILFVHPVLYFCFVNAKYWESNKFFMKEHNLNNENAVDIIFGVLDNIKYLEENVYVHPALSSALEIWYQRDGFTFTENDKIQLRYRTALKLYAFFPSATMFLTDIENLNKDALSTFMDTLLELTDETRKEYLELIVQEDIMKRDFLNKRSNDVIQEINRDLEYYRERKSVDNMEIK